MFCDRSRDVAMATNLGTKSAKSAYSPLFVALAFRNGLEYRNADGRVNSGNDLTTSFENLGRIKRGSEIKRGTGKRGTS